MHTIRFSQERFVLKNAYVRGLSGHKNRKPLKTAGAHHGDCNFVHKLYKLVTPQHADLPTLSRLM